VRVAGKYSPARKSIFLSFAKELKGILAEKAIGQFLKQPLKARYLHAVSYP
jgi:hypothetical protein